MLVLLVGVEDPGSIEALAVDRVHLEFRIEQPVEVVLDGRAGDDAHLPVVEVVPHDQLEPPIGVDEMEDGQLHRLGDVGADDENAVLESTAPLVIAGRVQREQSADGVRDELTLLSVERPVDQVACRRVVGPPVGELHGRVESIEF